MPSTVVSSIASRISSRVAPCCNAFRMCRRTPGAYKCVVAALIATRISSLTFGASGPLRNGTLRSASRPRENPGPTRAGRPQRIPVAGRALEIRERCLRLSVAGHRVRLAVIGLPPWLFANHVGGLLADHDRGGVGVRRGDRRHHRDIDDPQPLHAVHAKPWIDDGIAPVPHAARADGMPRGLAGLADVVEQRASSVVAGPGRGLRHDQGCHRRLRGDSARKAQQRDRGVAIVRVLK